MGTGDEIAAEIVERWGRLTGESYSHLQRRTAEMGLSMPEAKAIMSLADDRTLSMRELAAAIHASPSNVTVTVDRLQSRGLVGREEGDDRRVRGVRLTDAGRALKRNLDERVVVDHPALRGLDAAEREALLALLRRLTADCRQSVV